MNGGELPEEESEFEMRRRCLARGARGIDVSNVLSLSPTISAEPKYEYQQIVSNVMSHALVVYSSDTTGGPLSNPTVEHALTHNLSSLRHTAQEAIRMGTAELLLQPKGQLPC